MGIVTKVLCVDDNPDAARSTATLLELHGCDARAAADGPAALCLARDFRPDVCVIDLTMPGMGGAELAAKLRADAGDRPLRVIALTGRWDVDAQHQTHNAGFDDHLVKPVDPARLVEAVNGTPAAA